MYESVADGYLTNQLEVRSSDIISRMIKAISEIGKTADLVTTSSNQVTAGSEDVSKAIVEIATGRNNLSMRASESLDSTYA